MLKAIIITLYLLTFSYAYTQELAANGSFEDRNRCTEFNAVCAPEAWFFVPNYVKAAQVTGDSNHYEIISMSRGGNFMYTKLLCTLQRGKEYSFSIDVTTTGSRFRELDIWLGTNEPGQLNTYIPFNEAAFTITEKNKYSTKGMWQKYTITYTAKGNERFMMIGNLTRYSKAGVRAFDNNAMYWIDNISLRPVDTTEKNCPEYNAVLRQVYDQNFRHPARLIEEVPLDTLVVPKDTVVHKKTVQWVVVDTPPSMKIVNDTLIIPDVLFEFNSSKINPSFTKSLDSLINKITGKVYSKMYITGHTDNAGTPAYNKQLSYNRAEAIKAYLLKKLGISESIVYTKGEGELQPAATNKTPEGRQKNRRVEIILKR